MAYAKKEFELDKKPKDSNCTLREHLLAIQEQTGSVPEELENIEISPAISYLLGFFMNYLFLDSQVWGFVLLLILRLKRGIDCFREI
ncbi:hypothetical protein [Glaesserella parasuis]|uniref:hypothetical protein n=1 Tax=Glaesserella parasuis TaxID=738 RepID=UPI0024366474|nr:hypothetical protein [Glaesserella parasuis]MDP0097323.1 hypothetical protein [Glaesserella parasuis]